MNIAMLAYHYLRTRSTDLLVLFFFFYSVSLHLSLHFPTQPTFCFFFHHRRTFSSSKHSFFIHRRRFLSHIVVHRLPREKNLEWDLTSRRKYLSNWKTLKAFLSSYCTARKHIFVVLIIFRKRRINEKKKIEHFRKWIIFDYWFVYFFDWRIYSMLVSRILFVFKSFVRKNAVDEIHKRNHFQRFLPV